MEWSMLLSVVTINLLLSSDNALAIAMASRRLPAEYRMKAVRWGSLCAVFLQIVLTYMATLLLSIPFLKVVGGVLLAWIAAKMICTNEEQEEASAEGQQSATLLSSIKMIAIANLVMCLDNTVAVAAIVGNNTLLLGLGIVISFPIIMWGSSLVANLLERFPVLIWMGSVFLGWTAGGIITSDAALNPMLSYLNIDHTSVSAIIALGVSFMAWKQATQPKTNDKTEISS